MRIDVDYEHHPAFAPYIVDATADPSFAAAIVEMDEVVNSHVFGCDAQKEGITCVVERLRCGIDDDPVIEPGLKPFILDAVSRAIDRTVDEQKRRAAWPANVRKARRRARNSAEQLLDRGCVIYHMPRSILEPLQQALAPDLDKLRLMAAEAPDDILVTPPTNTEAVTILNEFCRTSGLFETLEAYYGQAFNCGGFVVHYSHPKDSWFRMFDDLPLDMPRTTQMHYDLDFYPPKAMLYLNDVGEAQGPFSLVPKASEWELFGFEHALRKETLKSVSAYTTSAYGKSVRGNTSIFRFREARRAFASLPRSLRGTSHPGDHIVDNSDLSLQLLAAETPIVGEAGTMPLFAGSHVLHRGGLVKNGERIALQIVMQWHEATYLGQQQRRQQQQERRLWTTVKVLANRVRARLV